MLILIVLFSSIFLLFTSRILSEVKMATAEQDFNYQATAKAFEKKCGNDDGWRNCYGKEIRTLYKETGSFDIALKTIKTLQDVDYKARDCHILAHELTREMVESDPVNWDTYLDIIDPSDCNYGYIHGILESRKRFDTSFVLNSQTINDFCQKLVERKGLNGIDQTCSHIMGHLVLVETVHNIEEGKKICWGIREHLQKECFSGLFMENFTRDNLVDHGIAEYVPWDKERIYAQEDLCAGEYGNAGLGCWQELSNMYLQFDPYDHEMVFELCGRAGNDEYRDQCYFDSLPSLMALPKPTRAAYRAMCEYYHDDQHRYDICNSYAVASLLGASDKNIDRVNIYCTSLFTESESRDCYRLTGYIVRGKHGAQRHLAICKKVPEEYQRECNLGHFDFSRPKSAS